MNEKMKRAGILLDKAKEQGCNARLQGSWVVFEPPIPVDLLMEAIELNNEVMELVRSIGSLEHKN